MSYEKPLPKIDALIARNVIERNRDQKVIDVIAAQMGIAVGGDDFKDAFMQFENGNVEGPAAEIVDGDDAFFLAIETIRQGGGCGLIHQAQNFEARHAPGILRCLPLSIIEVRRHRDYRLGHGRAKISFRVALELAQNVRGNLRRRKAQFPQLNARDLIGVRIRIDVFGEAKREQFQFALNFRKASPHESLD